MSNGKEFGMKYSRKVYRDKEEVLHQERWSADKGRVYAEHLIEEGSYQIGVGSGYQPPLFFKSRGELEDFVKFIGIAVFNSLVIHNPRERRGKRAYIRKAKARAAK